MESTVDHQIYELRQKKFTIEQIAEYLDMTVGQVKYRLYKKSGAVAGTKPISCNEENSQAHPLPPLYYGKDEITLMVQSPSSLYTYWEITWSCMKMVSDFFHTPFECLARVLRVYDVTDIWFDGRNAHGYQDISLQPEADNWFIQDVLPGRTYVIDLGILWEGRFIPLLRSQAKSTPRDREAGEWCEYVTLTAHDPKERVKPRWFENFSAYSIY